MQIRDPGIPRATKAVTVEKPDGNMDSPDNRTVMQQHVDFFDFDKDGAPPLNMHGSGIVSTSTLGMAN